MSDDRWIEVVSSFDSAVKHFETAQKLYALGSVTSDEEQDQIYALAFMHAMQVGHTSLESGMVRIMRMVGEVLPAGDDWHADVIKRMGEGIEGKRPALWPPDLSKAIDLTRRFRHVAVRTYDDFNWEDARRPVEAAGLITGSVIQVLTEFRQQLDPSDREDGSGGGASHPPAPAAAVGPRPRSR